MFYVDTRTVYNKSGPHLKLTNMWFAWIFCMIVRFPLFARTYGIIISKNSTLHYQLLRHGVSNQRQFDCLSNHMVRVTSKTTSKFSITGLLWVEYIQQFPHKGSVLEWRQISVMSNHRRLDYPFNSLSGLITKKKSKLCISGSLWGESGDRWIPLGKSRQFKKRFRAY